MIDLILKPQWTLRISRAFRSKGYNYYTKEEFYDDKNAIGKDFESYFEAYQKSKVKAVLTETELMPVNVPLTSHRRQLLRTVGRCKHRIADSGPVKNCETYFYETRMGKFRFTTQLHFYNKTMFFARTDIKAETGMSPKINKTINKLVLKKYLSSDQIDLFEERGFILRDEKGNGMMMKRDLEATRLIYVSGNSALYQTIRDASRDTNRTRERKRSSLLNMIYEKI